nr:CAP domain-containing protein [Hyphomonas sp. Mor2]
MQASERPETLANYVMNGEACLDEPPQAFRFDPFTEQMFVDAVNDARDDHGLDRLAIRFELRPAARFHSLDMGSNEFFGHQSPDGRSHVARVAAFDRTLLAEGTAENLAQFGPSVCVDHRDREISCTRVRGFVFPERDEVVRNLHEKLMNSEGHRRNILDPDMTHIAVGVARTETGFYVTQLFADVLGDLSEPAPLMIRASQALHLTAEAPGWDVANLALSHQDEVVDLEMGRIPANISGDIGLSIRAETKQEFEEGPITRTLVTWIYPSGPTIEILPPTGS